ncbi:MAG: TMEM165/GDT1 family protein [Coriobacteriia bacterium]|nr:TMEM165/GDT1 family protein [Coriobacteriia bacterium]
MVSAFAIAFVLVALAELGDKSQLLLLAFAARYKPVKVLVGAAIAIFCLQAVGVVLGRAAGALLPERLVAVAAGLLFIGFGIVTWRGAGDESKEGSARAAGRFGPVFTVALAVLLAEFGDKTQLMTVSIAADPAAALRTLGSLAPAITAPEPGSAGTALGVWLGSSLGFLAADAIAIVAGALLGARLPTRTIARLSAVVFVLFGVVTLASAFVAT